ncbi:hypothetical protein BofuT4_uP076340.1 [Botrytis cinerea T4]|uniref:Uncharacterized protein n=1 Tax=Botryotinia fuckeliana (strain T4) TaxID=999810 RepID=G2XNU5_BOTF4|nr:hypothetical protein BofuT4_uP076340.1 [Botrytis cinerea T4]
MSYPSREFALHERRRHCRSWGSTLHYTTVYYVCTVQAANAEMDGEFWECGCRRYAMKGKLEDTSAVRGYDENQSK